VLEEGRNERSVVAHVAEKFLKKEGTEVTIGSGS